MRRALIVWLVLGLTGCSAGPSPTISGGTPTASVPTEASPSPSPAGDPEPAAFPPADKPLPGRPGKFARALRAIERDLPGAVATWLQRGGRRRSRLGRTVALGALWQQRLYRRLVVRPRLERRVLRKLPRRLRTKAKAHVDAGRGLRALATPLDPPVKLKTHPPDRHRVLRRAYRAGERRFSVPWEVLASVNFVESKFGRLLGPSSAGARGPMQFLPSTWEVYGRGNIMNPRDAILGAARYLSASGAPDRMRDALYAYNRSNAYVDAILVYASEIARRPRSFYAYYFWQVFVRTTKGDLQLTGPGRDR